MIGEKEKKIREIKTLVRLAQVDGVLSNDEVSFIKNLSKVYGISEEELDEIFASDCSVMDTSTLSAKEKFEHMYSVIYLAKVDGRVYKEEIVTCLQVGEKLGFDGKVLQHFLIHVKAHDQDIEKEKRYIRRLIEKTG